MTPLSDETTRLVQALSGLLFDEITEATKRATAKFIATVPGAENLHPVVRGMVYEGVLKIHGEKFRDAAARMLRGEQIVSPEVEEKVARDMTELVNLYKLGEGR